MAIKIKHNGAWVTIPTGENLIEVTYAQLKVLVDGEALSKGTLYRITDFCTVNGITTTSAGHPFDVIVRAVSNKKLSDQALATVNATDATGYWDTSDLSKWRLLYDFEGNTKSEFYPSSGVVTPKYVIGSSEYALTAEPSSDFTLPSGKSYYGYYSDDRGITVWTSDQVIVPSTAYKENTIYHAVATADVITDATSTTIVIGGVTYTYTSAKDITIKSSGSPVETDVYYAWVNGDVIKYTTTSAPTTSSKTYTLPEDITGGDLEGKAEYGLNPNAKGVITYLKDEWGNEAYYDFKNLKYGGKYTFNDDDGGDYDQSVVTQGIVANNYIGNYASNGYIKFPNIRFSCYPSNTTFKDGCHDIYIETTGSTIKNVEFNGNSYLKITISASPYTLNNATFLAGVNGLDYKVKTLDITVTSDNYTTYIAQPTNQTKNTKIWNIADAEEVSMQIEVTYSQLQDLITASELKPGCSYLITDFCTKVDATNFESANNKFGVIVYAETTTKLGEYAKAVITDTAGALKDAALDKWILKYDINGAKYDWISTDGGTTLPTDFTGVITYMKDEFGNEAPYDFKNIKFKKIIGKLLDASNVSYGKSPAYNNITVVSGTTSTEYNAYKSQDATDAKTYLTTENEFKADSVTTLTPISALTFSFTGLAITAKTDDTITVDNVVYTRCAKKDITGDSSKWYAWINDEVVIFTDTLTITEGSTTAMGGDITAITPGTDVTVTYTLNDTINGFTFGGATDGSLSGNYIFNVIKPVYDPTDGYKFPYVAFEGVANQVNVDGQYITLPTGCYGITFNGNQYLVLQDYQRSTTASICNYTFESSFGGTSAAPANFPVEYDLTMNQMVGYDYNGNIVSANLLNIVRTFYQNNEPLEAKNGDIWFTA